MTLELSHLLTALLTESIKQGNDSHESLTLVKRLEDCLLQKKDFKTTRSIILSHCKLVLPGNKHKLVRSNYVIKLLAIKSKIHPLWKENYTKTNCKKQNENKNCLTLIFFFFFLEKRYSVRLDF